MPINLNEAINKHKGLIYSQLKRYNLYGDFEAESQAYEALWNAIETYNPEHSSKANFGTYAIKCISNALGTYIRTLNRVKQLEEVSIEDWYEQSTDKTLIENVLKQQDQSKKIEYALTKLQRELVNPTHIKLYKVWEQNDFTASTIDIAKKVGCSQPYISQTLAVFKYKIRTTLEEVNYE